MKHKIIFILTGLLIIGIATFFYIDTIFLPVQFKRYIISRAEKYLQREVSIGSIDFRLIKGFLIENVTIARKDDPHRPFIQIKEIGFSLLLAPIFQKQAIILPYIKIRDPYVYLTRNENRIWNFSDLSNIGKTLNRKNSLSILLRKLNLEGGEIHYTDKTSLAEFSETIENIEINATLSLNKGIRFIVKAEVPERETTISVKGNYTLITKKMTAQILLSNINLARYLPLTTPSRPYIDLAEGVLTSADFGLTYKNRELQAQGSFDIDQMSMRVGENRRIDGAIHVPEVLLTWRDKKWDAKGLIQLPSVHMTASGNKEFRGDITAHLNLLTIFSNRMTSQGDVTIDNATFAIGKDRYLKGNITAMNASLVKGDGSIRLQGNFDIKKTFVNLGKQGSLKGDLSTKDTKLVWSIDEKGNPTLDVQSGFIMSGAELTLGENRSMSGNVNIHKVHLLYASEKVTAEMSGQLEAADIRLTTTRSFQGSPHFNIYYTYDPKDKDPIDYKGTFRFTNSLLTGVPYVDQVSNIAGSIAIMPDHIQTDKIIFNTQETDIQLSGLLTNFTKPVANINASSKNVRIEKILKFFPTLKEKINADLTGKAIVHIRYNGPVHSPSDAVIESTAQLSEATVMHERLAGIITGISGSLFYRKDYLRWQNLLGHYRGEPYMLNGELNNFSRPTIDTTVVSSQLDLTAQIKLLRSAFQLKTFAGNYLNSSFNLRGDIHLFEDEDADIDLRGDFTLNLKDVGSIIPRLKYRVQQFDPVGILTGEGIYKGKINDWRNWKLAFDAKSDGVTLKGYRFDNISIRFTQRDLTISKCNVSSRVYGGELAVTSSADLRSNEVPFNVTFDLKDLDLAQLREDRKTKNRQLAGNLSLDATLQGEAEEWREMTGEGSVNVSEGYLWQWNILSSMSKALLITEFKNLVFTEARGDFSVHDQRIFTNNTQLISNLSTLDAKGWIDFGSNLNFDITPNFSKLAIIQSGSMKKGPTSIITQTDGYLNIKLTGTLQKPRFKVEKFPLKILEETIGATTGTLKAVIGGIVGEIF